MLLLSHVEKTSVTPLGIKIKNQAVESGINWTLDGMAFAVTDKSKFVRDVLPQFFPKSSKFASFARKLYRWGFRQLSATSLLRIMEGKGKKKSKDLVFGHQFFQRDQKNLMAQMKSVTAIGTRRALASIVVKQKKEMLRKLADDPTATTGFPSPVAATTGPILDDISILVKPKKGKRQTQAQTQLQRQKLEQHQLQQRQFEEEQRKRQQKEDTSKMQELERQEEEEEEQDQGHFGDQPCQHQSDILNQDPLPAAATAVAAAPRVPATLFLSPLNTQAQLQQLGQQQSPLVPTGPMGVETAQMPSATALTSIPQGTVGLDGNPWQPVLLGNSLPFSLQQQQQQYQNQQYQQQQQRLIAASAAVANMMTTNVPPLNLMLDGGAQIGAAMANSSSTQQPSGGFRRPTAVQQPSLAVPQAVLSDSNNILNGLQGHQQQEDSLTSLRFSFPQNEMADIDSEGIFQNLDRVAQTNQLGSDAVPLRQFEPQANAMQSDPKPNQQQQHRHAQQLFQQQAGQFDGANGTEGSNNGAAKNLRYSFG